MDDNKLSSPREMQELFALLVEERTPYSMWYGEQGKIYKGAQQDERDAPFYEKSRQGFHTFLMSCHHTHLLSMAQVLLLERYFREGIILWWGGRYCDFY